MTQSTIKTPQAGPYETTAAAARREQRARVAADFRDIMTRYPDARLTAVYGELAVRYGLSPSTVTRYVKQSKTEAV